MLSALLVLAGLLAAVAVLALVASPAIGVLVLVVSKPIIDTSFYRPLFMELSITRIVAVLVPSVLLGHMFTARGARALRHMPLRGVWLAYSADVCLFSLLVVYGQGPLAGVDVFFRHISGLVGAYMFQAYFHEDARLRRLLLALAVAGLFPMAIGLYQALTGHVWTHVWLGAFTLQVEGLTRYTGLYHDVHTVRYYASQTILALLLLLALYPPRVRAARLALFGYGLVSVLVLLKAWTKAGAAALAAWSLIWPLARRRYRELIVVGLAVFVLAPLYLGEIVDNYQRVFSKEVAALEGGGPSDTSLEGRWGGWRSMWEHWQGLDPLQQIFGSGLPAYGAHNAYLSALYHGGVLGLGLYLALLLAAGLALVRGVRRRNEPLRVAALMVYTMYLIDTIGLVPSVYPGYQWFVWGIIGLSLRRAAEERRLPLAAASQPPAPGPVLHAVPAVLPRRARQPLHRAARPPGAVPGGRPG